MKQFARLIVPITVSLLCFSCGGSSGPMSGGETGGPVTTIAAIEERTTITADGAYNGSPSVAALPDGDLLITYVKGTSHAVINQLASRTSADGGLSWGSESVEPYYSSSIAARISKTPSGAYVGFSQRRPASTPFGAFTRSVDGVTWSPFTALLSYVPAPSELPIADGADLYITEYNTSIQGGLQGDLLRSSDDGLSWSFVSTIRGTGENGITETALCKVGTKLLAVSRADDNHHTYAKFSSDMGQTWGPQLDYTAQVGTLQLPQLVNMGSFVLLLGRNPAANQLVAYLSQDGGLTFANRVILDTYTGIDADGGYCWPLVMDDGRVFIVYYADSNGLRLPDIKSLKLRFATHQMAIGWGISAWSTDPWSSVIAVQTFSENFDRLLTGEATVYKKVGGNRDKSGIEDQTLISIFAASIPCRDSSLSDAREYKVEKQSAIADRKLYMRPQLVEITEKMVIDLDGIRYNPLSVKKVKALDNSVHHLEILVETVRV